MRVALVYDRVTKWGGAERVLVALHRLWPDAPLYTAVYDKKRARWADVFRVIPSFLQYIPFANRLHELLPWITPMAFESFSFDDFDVVISVTSAEAKGIITKPNVLHICYCLTPTRYLWSGYDQYRKDAGLGIVNGIAGFWLTKLAPTLRVWDRVAAARPDTYVAISNRVKDRIKKYYDRTTQEVIYPPVETALFSKQLLDMPNVSEPYFLTVSRLVGYKRVDVLIRAFNKSGQKLVIIGEGHQKKYLKQIARSNIEFIDHHLTDLELVRYHQGCRAFVYAADEDFGIAVVEAQASGKPVIAYSQSAVAESVLDGKTGILY
ncbi:glycosyltransferase, partial [Candidatus Woesebacteria bacterium]|nr:glycosyltransferase [Candidatus Woesebacteria bacterium]